MLLRRGYVLIRYLAGADLQVSVLHTAASGYEDRIVQLRTILLDLGNSSSFRHRQT